jgi:hypothetical protein
LGKNIYLFTSDGNFLLFTLWLVKKARDEHDVGGIRHRKREEEKQQIDSA